MCHEMKKDENHCFKEMKALRLKFKKYIFSITIYTQYNFVLVLHE